VAEFTVYGFRHKLNEEGNALFWLVALDTGRNV